MAADITQLAPDREQAKLEFIDLATNIGRHLVRARILYCLCNLRNRILDLGDFSRGIRLLGIKAGTRCHQQLLDADKPAAQIPARSNLEQAQIMACDIDHIGQKGVVVVERTGGWRAGTLD